MQRQYLTFKEASERYGVSVTCLRRGTRDEGNRLPFLRPNGQKRGLRLYAPDVEAWLQRSRVGGEA